MNKLLLTVISILALAISSTAFAYDSGPYNVTVENSITVDTNDGTRIYGDLYKPTDAPGLRPAIMFFHGGGFVGGTPSYPELVPILKYYASHGYVVFSGYYRLLGEGGIFPNNVKDAKCGMAWLRRNAAPLGIDPARIAVMGESAGAYIASMVAYTPGDPYFQPTCPVANGIDSSAQAAVLFYTPADFLTVNAARKGIPAMLELEIRNRVKFKTKAEMNEYKRKNSPVNHAHNAPPTILLNTDPDTTLPSSQSNELEAALTAAGKTVLRKTYSGPGLDHGFILYSPDSGESRDALKSALDFLDKYLVK